MFSSIIQNIFVDFFQNISNSIPPLYKPFISLFFYTIFISLYSVFIWKFYKFLAKRDILELNLKKYKHSKHPKLETIFAMALYTLEYIVILPFLVLFWFIILALFLLILSKSVTINQILLISAAIIASTRITAYISENLSKDLAKIFPFTVLATFLLDTNFFNFSSTIQKILEIPSLFTNILGFIIFCFIVELFLRIIYFFTKINRSSNKINENSPKKDFSGEAPEKTVPLNPGLTKINPTKKIAGKEFLETEFSKNHFEKNN